MGVVTVQLGQCGNQLGDALFQTLAAEFESADYGQDAVEQFFRPLAKPLVTRAGVKTCAARSVMIDMEPKVIHAARAAAAASPSFWSYADAGCFFAQSGAGNNWAQGFHRFGPKVRDEALDLVRREVEAADLLDGFFLLQSMAGGTGAGFGTYVAEALRDEYGGAHMMNCCVWPYDSGEVSVQSYNTLLTLSHLAEASDGVVLMANDALHQTCVKLHGIQRPGFNDMNAVAARALAGFMLPASHRPLAPAPLAAQPQPPTPPTLPFHPLADALAHLCGHPGYRLLTLRSVPSVPAAHVDFTTFTWPAILKRLRAMCGAASAVEEGFGAGALDTAAAGMPPGSPADGRPAPRAGNRCLAASLFLRGSGSKEVDPSEHLLADGGLLAPGWAPAALQAAAAPQKFARCAMSATLLSNDQTHLAPIRKMLDTGYTMLAARAFLHQYESYGHSAADMYAAFARAEELASSYAAM